MKYKVIEHTTNRGSKGLVVSVPGAPVVAMDFQFRAGYRYVKDYDHKSQAPHVMEHIVTSCCQKYPDPIEYATIFSKNGAYSNAYTSPSELGYVATCADFEWERIIDLMRQEICTPCFNEKMFRSELSTIRSELTTKLSQPGRLLGPKLTQAMGAKVKTYPEYIASLDNISLADVIEHRQRTHTAGGLRFVIAGDFSGKLTKLYRALDSFDLPVGQRPSLYVDKLHSAPATVINSQDFPSITFGFTMTVLRELSDDQCQSMDCLCHILTGTMRSRIFGQARKKGLLYGCGSRCSTTNDCSSWDFSGRANNDRLTEVFDLIINELARIKNGQIDEQDIVDAKSYAMGKFRMGIQTAGQLVNYLSGRYFFDGYIKKYDDEPAMIEVVSREQIVEQAREFFKANVWSVGLHGATNQAMGDQLQAKLSKLFD